MFLYSSCIFPYRDLVLKGDIDISFVRMKANEPTLSNSWERLRDSPFGASVIASLRATREEPLHFCVGAILARNFKWKKGMGLTLGLKLTH